MNSPYFSRPPPIWPILNDTKKVRLLMVVEGHNDVYFFRRISGMLHRDDKSLPDLASMELQGRLIFLPQGGTPDLIWCNNLAPLGIPEFHLYDKETDLETITRQ